MSNLRQQNALILFVEDPFLGQPMTSLQRELGLEKALEVHRRLLEHIRNAASAVNADRYLFYDGYIDWNDLWLVAEYLKRLQQGGGQAAGQQYAFETVFAEG